MISEVEANKIDQWLRKFQKDHGNEMVVNDDIIRDLACALCDDIPLGYEASHRLANWLFCHLNAPKISGELLEKVQHAAEHQENAADRLTEAFYDYKRCSRYLLTVFNVLQEAE